MTQALVLFCPEKAILKVTLCPLWLVVPLQPSHIAQPAVETTEKGRASAVSEVLRATAGCLLAPHWPELGHSRRLYSRYPCAWLKIEASLCLEGRESSRWTTPVLSAILAILATVAGSSPLLFRAQPHKAALSADSAPACVPLVQLLPERFQHTWVFYVSSAFGEVKQNKVILSNLKCIVCKIPCNFRFP